MDTVNEDLDCLTTAVINIDYASQIVSINTATESLFGLSRPNLFGVKLENLIVEKKMFSQILQDAFSEKFSNKRLHAKWITPSEGLVELDTICTTVKSPRVFCCFELRKKDKIIQINKEERQADLVDANRALLRNLGHEVKNPLGGIRGAAQLLDSELPNQYLKEYTQIIIKEADRLQSLVDAILLPSKNNLSHVLINIHELCERVNKLISSEFSNLLKIYTDYDVSIPLIKGDEIQLVQVILNLMKNAAQSIQEQGSGEITIKTRIARQITLKKRRCSIALNLHIIDNGPGISKNIKDKIFYPLVSSKHKGQGLGLTIAQSIINSHGGLIDCYSETGLTDFKVILPVRFADEPC
jgi:two-component system nitrogen regulation sensor histidine kinase GlnL